MPENIKKTESEQPLFSRQAVIRLVLPLIVEQLLAVTVGMADTLMIAVVGEAAVSGIALVDQINTLIIQLFAALATGGAVITAQLIGEKNEKRACRSANQLILICFVIASVIAVLCLLFNPQMVSGIYGSLEPEVYAYARTYFYITAISFPFLAIYNAGAALCRSMGNSAVSMKVALLMNILNIAGNAFLINVVHMEVAGAAVSTLFSRMVSGLIMVAVVSNGKMQVHILRGREEWKPDKRLISRILTIGTPVAFENCLFQGGKLLIARLISTFGTSAIAANAMAGNISAVVNMPGSAIQLAVITMVGQAVGARRDKEARRYTVRMILLASLMLFAMSMLVLIFLNPLTDFYHFSPETAGMAKEILIMNAFFCFTIWPWSFVLPNALRAAGDVKYVMIVAVLSMLVVRIALSYVLGENFGMGLRGVWIAMFSDWGVRASFFVARFRSGRWLDRLRKDRIAASNG